MKRQKLKQRNTMMRGFIALIIVSWVGFIGAQDVDYSGTSAANFLKLGVGARQVAMGDAASAVVTDASALFWNPAAITRIAGHGGVTLVTMDWLVDSRLSYGAVTLNLPMVGSLGFDIQYLDYGKVEETTVYDQDGTGRFFGASDMAVGLAYARRLTDRFAFGVKAKYVREQLANASASAFGFDMGAVFRTTFFNNNLWLAATLTNFGTKMKFGGPDLSVVYTIPGNPANKQVPAVLETLEWELPLAFRFGIANYFVKNETVSWLVSYDVFDSRDFRVRHNLGTEVGYQDAVYLRAGYKLNYNEVTYTVGVGFNLEKYLHFPLMFDYSFVNYGPFGGLHQMTINMNY